MTSNAGVPPPDILGMLIFFGTLAGTVLLVQIYATRRERMRQETLRAMVEKGIEVPRELVVRSAGPLSDLRRGLVLLGAGLGLSLAFTFVRVAGQGGSGLWSVGLVPGFMGAGYLAVWLIGKRNVQGG